MGGGGGGGGGVSFQREQSNFSLPKVDVGYYNVAGVHNAKAEECTTAHIYR